MSINLNEALHKVHMEYLIRSFFIQEIFHQPLNSVMSFWANYDSFLRMNLKILRNN
jgi:hypothetical protein